MSWNRSIPSFHFFLVILLVKDLGSQIFVAANALDCFYGYDTKAPTRPIPQPYPYICEVTDKITYDCKKCGRPDGLLPSALDCVDDNGKQVGAGKFWNCDVTMNQHTDTRSDGRQILCQHYVGASGGAEVYYCRKINKQQQCERAGCRLSP